MVERGIGQWKRRFYVLHGEVRLEPAKACKIIIACAALHNIANILRMPEFDDEGHVNDANFELNDIFGDDIAGVLVRNNLANTF